MKRPKTVYKEVLQLNSDNCQDHNGGFSDIYFERLVHWIVNKARLK